MPLADFRLLSRNLLCYNDIDKQRRPGLAAKGLLEKGWMSCSSIPVVRLFAMLCTAIIFGAAGACSPDHYKADADKDVYKILDDKWHPNFGQQANYVIKDANTILSPTDIKLEAVPAAPESISLAQAVAIATANSRTYQSQKETLYLSALSLTGVRHDYEQQWFATIDGAYVNDSASEKDFSLHSNVGTQRDFLFGDGIEVGTTLAVDWVRFLTGDPRTTLGSVLTASATAPLLGAGTGKQKQETLIQTERQVLYDIRSFNRFRQSFVVDTVNSYYGVLQNKDSVTNAENNYKRVLESKDRLEMEAQAGRKTRMDVDEAQQNVLRAQDTLVRAQQDYERALDNFKIRLALPTDANIVLDQNELKALADIGVGVPGFTLDASVETALLRRLDLANSQDKIDDALRKVTLAADGLGPQLNVSAGVGYSSSPDNTQLERIQFNQGSYNLGFDADLPLDRKLQRNNYRRSLIDLQRQQRQYEGDVDTIKLQVREAYRLLIETADRYRIQKNSLDLARQRVESNELLLNAGRVTVRILLESQDALVQAENAVTAALVDHLDAKLSFYRDVGILQVKPDGMWAKQDIISEKLTNGNANESQKPEDNS